MAGEIAFVLHRPRIADNVGGVARAMANFGLARLTLSEPATWHFDSRSAVKAEHVLERAYLARSLDVALGPFAWVCGTTSRRIRRLPALTPREMAVEAHRRAAAGADVCVLLGTENHGLTDEDLLRCDAICRIPTGEEQPSINLAQASAIFAYELRVASLEPRPPRQPARAATRDELGRLEGFGRDALLDVGFLNPQQPEQVLAELRRLLVRAEPTQREVELLTAAVKQIQRAARVPPRR
jgi:TrmH family RNA methyltransferase